MKTIRNNRKRVIAMLAALLMITALIPADVSAATLKTGKSGTSVAEKLGKGTSGYYSRASRLLKHQVKVSGTKYLGYCLDTLDGFYDGYTYKTRSASSDGDFSSLSKAKRTTLALIMLYGYHNGKSAPYGNKNDYYAATQAMVWDVIDGGLKVNSSTGKWSGKTPNYNLILKGHSNGRKNYNDIKSKVTAHLKGASFTTATKAAAKTYTMKYHYATKKFSVALSDSRKGNTYQKSSFTSGLSMSRSSYQYTFSAAKAGTYTAALANRISTGTSQPMLVFKSPDPTLQSILFGATDSTKYYVKLKTETTGKAQIKKTSDDGAVSGFTFRVKCAANGYDASHTTSSTGVITLNLYPGTYTVTEVLTSAQKAKGYTAPAAKTITVTSGKTSAITMHNKRAKGTAQIRKTSDDGAVAGFTFNVKCTANNYNRNHTTGSSGIIALNLYPGTYTVTEILTSAQKTKGYVAPAAKTITVTSNKTSTITMHNKRPKGTARIIKTSDTGVVTGFAFRIKASDGSYNKTFTTGSDGVIKAGLYPGKYTITEVLTETQRKAGYLDADPVTISIKSGETRSIPVHNAYDPSWDKVRIRKSTTDDGPLEGFRFKVTSVRDDRIAIDLDDILKLSAPAVSDMEDYEMGEWKAGEGAMEVIDDINTDATAGKTGVYEIALTNTAERNADAVDETLPESAVLSVNVTVKLERVDRKTSAGEKKTDETGRIAWNDVIWAGAATVYESEGVTDSRGSIVKEDLPPGTYTVTELLTGDQRLRYHEPRSQTVSIIEGGQAASVSFENVAKEAPVKIRKSCSDGKVAGIEFTVTGKTAWGEEIEPIVADTNENGEIDVTLYSGTYVIHETGLDPALYVEQEPQTITVTGEEEEAVEVSFVNVPYVDVSISKKDITTKEELPGAALQLMDGETEQVLEEWISDSVPHVIEGLVEGKEYILRETAPPEGYGISEEIRFTAGQTEQVEMMDEPTAVTIRKLDEEGKLLKGAALQILDAETKEVAAEWISEEEPLVMEGLIYGKEYILHEVQAPAGHVPAEDVKFTVGIQETVEMTDMPTTLRILKLDEMTEAPLPGAVFEILDAESEEKIVRAETEDGGACCIKGLEEGRDYILRELKAPEGYTAGEDIPFRFTEGMELEVENGRPQLSTTAHDAENGMKISAADGSVRIVDTVEYRNIPEGVEYLLRAELMKKDGTPVLDESGSAVTADVVFTPSEQDGVIDAALPAFDGMGMGGEQVVIYETLYRSRDGNLIVRHADLDNAQQTIQLMEEEKVAAIVTGDDPARYLWMLLMATSGLAALCCMALRGGASRCRSVPGQGRRR